jgi:hypothetical protein
MARILNAALVAEEKMKNGFTREVSVFAGTAEENRKAEKPRKFNIGENKDCEVIKIGSPKWKNSEGRYKLWNEIHELQVKNAAVPLTPTETAALFAKLYIDIARNMDDLLDLTPSIALVKNDPNAPEVSYLRDLYPFVGKEKLMSGTNDKVPLIDAKTGTTETLTQEIRAFGWKASLKYMAFAPVNVLQKVTESAAIIAVDAKNQDFIAPIVEATYGALHAQAADATGSTYDLKMRNTIRKAVKTLGKLKHPMYTNKLVSSLSAFATDIGILCHPGEADDIRRAVAGWVGGGNVQDMSQIGNIGNILPYAGGIQDGETWGAEVLSLPGVAAGTAYMFIPDQAVLLNKRDITLETGNSSVLDLSTEERSWHRIRAKHIAYLLGGCATNTGKGCIIKITLPTE